LQEIVARGLDFFSGKAGGWVLGNYATLYLRNGRNSWRNHLYVHLADDGAGTRVSCRAYMSRVMIAIHACILLPFFGYLSIGWFAAVAFLVGCSAFWSAFIVSGLYLPREEPAILRERLSQALDAVPVSALPRPAKP
jgi:hypothetical protein